ncbi:MAG: hypothetical protein ACOYOF_18515, partial [Verrucomicrobiaceae bacterium]
MSDPPILHLNPHAAATGRAEAFADFDTRQEMLHRAVVFALARAARGQHGHEQHAQEQTTGEKARKKQVTPFKRIATLARQDLQLSHFLYQRACTTGDGFLGHFAPAHLLGGHPKHGDQLRVSPHFSHPSLILAVGEGE